MRKTRDEGEVLRRELGLRPNRRGWMDRALRARCVAYVRERCAAGVTCAAVAKELGLSQMTVYRWARDKTTTSSLVPVRVVDIPTAREVIVKTSRGLQVERLDFESLCALITRLG